MWLSAPCGGGFAEKLRSIIEMGFPEAAAREKLLEERGDVQAALASLLRVQSDDRGGHQGMDVEATHTNRPPWCCPLLSAPAMSDEEQQIAPEQQTDPPLDAADPSGPDKRGRKQGEPCGLQHIGNRELRKANIPTLFLVPGLVDCVLRYREESELPAKSERETTDGAASGEGEGTMADAAPLGEESARRHSSAAKRRGQTASQSLVLELRRLFAHMLLSKRKCVSPRKVLSHLVDENGTQEDVGQFSGEFFERLEEGFMQGAMVLPRPVSTHLPSPPTNTQQHSAGPAAAAAAAGAPNGADKMSMGNMGDEQQQQQPPQQEAAGNVGVSVLRQVFFGEGVQVLTAPANAPLSLLAPLLHRTRPQPPAATIAAAPRESDVMDDGARDAGRQEGTGSGSGGVLEEHETREFHQVILDLKQQNLYGGWESQNFNQAEYQVPEGVRPGRSTIQVQSEWWMKRSPSVLFFQLPRVVFDYTAEQQVQLNDPFRFATPIFVDRFMYANRTEALAIRKSCAKLKQEKALLESKLQQFSHISEAAIRSTATLFERLEKATHVGHQTDDELATSLLSGLGDGAAEKVHVAASVLGATASVVEEQRRELESRVNTLRGKIDKAHGHMQDHPYHLHALWIHQLDKVRRYWAYLRNLVQGTWYRVGDSNVSTVTSEEVMLHAEGTRSANGTNAYVAVYVDQSYAARCIDNLSIIFPPTHHQHPAEASNRNDNGNGNGGSWPTEEREGGGEGGADVVASDAHEYGGLVVDYLKRQVPQHLIDEIEKDNLALERGVDDWQEHERRLGILAKATEIYTAFAGRRHEYLNEEGDCYYMLRFWQPNALNVQAVKDQAHDPRLRSLECFIFLFVAYHWTYTRNTWGHRRHATVTLDRHLLRQQVDQAMRQHPEIRELLRPQEAGQPDEVTQALTEVIVDLDPDGENSFLLTHKDQATRAAPHRFPEESPAVVGDNNRPPQQHRSDSQQQQQQRPTLAELQREFYGFYRCVLFTGNVAKSAYELIVAGRCYDGASMLACLWATCLDEARPRGQPRQQQQQQQEEEGEEESPGCDEYRQTEVTLALSMVIHCTFEMLSNHPPEGQLLEEYGRIVSVYWRLMDVIEWPDLWKTAQRNTIMRPGSPFQPMRDELEQNTSHYVANIHRFSTKGEYLTRFVPDVGRHRDDMARYNRPTGAHDPHLMQQWARALTTAVTAATAEGQGASPVGRDGDGVPLPSVGLFEAHRDLYNQVMRNEGQLTHGFVQTERTRLEAQIDRRADGRH
ncbi:unnamed protein product [Vitrella brassicaformis CCMP3155]|uniref:UBA domain-containing protein n=1 Tax=Vitrella brassicaformis (strain CCMP3155) TaxID=1169540 RepID=A0A0G4EXP6_VITBC|nr:unnamed protein product [Vitrella brassicaformis CCMP3155]|eukprot:CEM03384.1 unnamed protein product [Vitrella brassicaformis CCMP3155]